jgi:hypothetical protein
VELVGPDQHKTPEVRTALQEFLEYRIRIKHPATVRALNMILKEFTNDSAETLIEALEYTMASETGNPNSKKGNWIQVVRPKESKVNPNPKPQPESFKQQDEKRSHEKRSAWIQTGELKINL